MIKIFYPYEYVDSVFVIDYEKLYQKGFKAVIFDIDNTLVHHGEDSTPEVDELFRQIQKIGLKTFLLSNNDEKRIKRFTKNIQTQFIADAAKPNPDSYLKALDILGVKRDEAVFIGDQVFTDIRGANRSQIPSILVKFMRYDTETKIGKKRTVENFILKLYSLSKTYRNRIGDILREE